RCAAPRIAAASAARRASSRTCSTCSSATSRAPRRPEGAGASIAKRRRRALHCSSARYLARVAMSEKKRPRRTRERILDASLALFNPAGEPNVTTADIADEMNISPGNLYYHFRNKDDIIGELFAAYAAEVAPLLAVPRGRAPDVEDLWLLLHLVFE